MSKPVAIPFLIRRARSTGNWIVYAPGRLRYRSFDTWPEALAYANGNVHAPSPRMTPNGWGRGWHPHGKRRAMFGWFFFWECRHDHELVVSPARHHA